MSDLPVTAPDTILARYEQGETMATIAQSLGLKGAEQIYRLLIEKTPDTWKSYQAARALRRLEDATEALEIAPDGLSLARAREQVKAAQWELERVLRRIYGQDQPGSGGAPVQINISLRGERATVAAQHNIEETQAIDSKGSEQVI